MSKSVIGIQLYSIRQSMKTAEDIVSSLKKVRTAGYENVELAGFGALEVSEWEKVLNNEGLTACSAHIGYDQLVNEFKDLVDKYKTIGCNNIVVPSMPKSFAQNVDGYKQFAQGLDKIGEQLAKEGMSLSYHNHEYELQKQGKTTGLNILFESSNPQYLKAQIDTYWIQFAGGDSAAWLQKYNDRLVSVHLKDMAILPGRKQINTEIGDGNLNWRSIISACKSGKVVYYIVEQEEFVIDMFESIARSFKNIKSMGIE